MSTAEPGLNTPYDRAFYDSLDGDVRASADRVAPVVIGLVHPASMLDIVAWAGLIGIVGLPSAVPPIGRTQENLPVGIQVVSPYLHDRRSVRVAKLIGEVVGGYGSERVRVGQR